MAALTDSAGAIILPHLEVADTFVRRLVGLQFRRSLAQNAGILISPCSSIHTCFMRFSIDVWMLDRQGVVLKFKRGVRPWTFVIAPRGTHSILETATNSISLFEGQQIAVRSGD